MRRLWDIVIVALVLSSAVMAAIFGASRSDWNNGSVLEPIAFIPCLVAALIWGIRSSLAEEQDRRRKWPTVLRDQRDWTDFVLEAVAVPLVGGVFVAMVLVIGVALITHAIVQ